MLNHVLALALARNLNYWDSVSTLAGEVNDPARTFPRAMVLAVLMVVLMYLLPTMAALGVTTDASEWSMGIYGRVAEKVSELGSETY